MSECIVCVECGGDDLHEFEFRTDHAMPRIFQPLNGKEKITEPYRLCGFYCVDCNAAVSTREEIKG